MRAATGDVPERVRGAKAGHRILRPTTIPVAFRLPTRDTCTLSYARTAMRQVRKRERLWEGRQGGGMGSAGWGSAACEGLANSTRSGAREVGAPFPGKGQGGLEVQTRGPEAGKGRDLLKKPSVGAACMSRTAASAKSAGTIPRTMLMITSTTGVRLTWSIQLIVSCGRQVACSCVPLLRAIVCKAPHPARPAAWRRRRSVTDSQLPAAHRPTLLSRCVPR